MIHWSWGVFKQRSFVSLHCYQNQPNSTAIKTLASCPSFGPSPAAGRGAEAVPSAPVVAGGRGGAGPRHPLAQNLGPATLFITRFGQIVVCNNNNNCCVELRGATAGAAELRGAAGSGGLYGRSRLAYVRKVRTLRETARARAGRPCGGSSRHSRLSTRADQRTGAWPLDARCEASATVLPAKNDDEMSHRELLSSGWLSTINSKQLLLGLQRNIFRSATCKIWVL